MNPKYTPVIIGLLLCCIPAVIYFTFRHAAGEDFNPYVRNQVAETTWPVEKQTDVYDIKLEPANTPLTRGKQRLTMTLESTEKTAAPAPAPQVKIVMPMGKETMEAPLTLKKLAQPNRYQIQTEFTMAGGWELQLKPSPKAEQIALQFQVQP